MIANKRISPKEIVLKALLIDIFGQRGFAVRWELLTIWKLLDHNNVVMKKGLRNTQPFVLFRKFEGLSLAFRYSEFYLIVLDQILAW